MRTTLNLDDDVVAELEAHSRATGRSRSRVANDLLREGIRARCEAAVASPYEPPTFDTGRPLVDVTDVAAALETLDSAG